VVKPAWLWICFTERLRCTDRWINHGLRADSVSQHVDNLLAACSPSRTVRQHGLPLPDDALHEVFQAVVVNKLIHASPAWWGFASADDRNHLEAFLRKSATLCYRAKRSTTFASNCDDGDCKLFTRITDNTQHLLYGLLPPEREHHYTQSLRQLPDRTSVLTNQKLYSENVNSRLSLFLLTILTFVISCVTVFYLLFDFIMKWYIV